MIYPITGQATWNLLYYPECLQNYGIQHSHTQQKLYKHHPIIDSAKKTKNGRII